MRSYYYPAIFTREAKNLYSVIFPDICGCATSGETVEEAHHMAEEALTMMLVEMERDNSPVPLPSQIEDFKPKDNQFVMMITCNTLAYRQNGHEKKIRKNVSLPEWISEEASARGIRCSAILLKALKQEMNIP